MLRAAHHVDRELGEPVIEVKRGRLPRLTERKVHVLGDAVAAGGGGEDAGEAEAEQVQAAGRSLNPSCIL